VKKNGLDKQNASRPTWTLRLLHRSWNSRSSNPRLCPRRIPSALRCVLLDLRNHRLRPKRSIGIGTSANLEGNDFLAKRQKEDDPVVDIRERLVKLETRLDGMDKTLADFKKRIETLDSRLWWLLGGIILSILLALLQFAKP